MVGEDVKSVDIANKLIINMKDNLEYVTAIVKLIMNLNNYTSPDLPPSPGTKAYRAPKEVLEKIFCNIEEGIKIGKLIGSDVEVKLNVNYLLSRHLAILAATGAGKSNTVAVLSSNIAEIGGTVVIFDVHGEYSSSTMNKELLPPIIGPKDMNFDELLRLLNLRDNAYVQQRILRKAYKRVMERISKEISLIDGNQFIEYLAEEVKKILGGNEETEEDKRIKERKDVVFEILNKLDDFKERVGYLIRSYGKNILESLMPGNVYVVDMSSLDEYSMDVVVSHFLRKMLEGRKNYLRRRIGGPKIPILIVIEEAHILLSREKQSLSSYWASKIAREGRKFGLGLCIVSQRPKSITQEVLSQMDNKIVLRIVEPTDQQYIMQSSDNMSSDLIDQLPSLNVGQAIIVGRSIKLPAIVQIEKFNGKLGGADPNIVKEWKDAIREMKEEENIARDVMAM